MALANNFKQRHIANIGVVAAVFALCSAAQASPITIDFDDQGLSEGDQIGDFYAFLGVTFVDAKVVKYGGFDRWGPSNAVYHSTSGSQPQPSDPIEAVFDYEVSFVSLLGDGIGLAGFRLSAYDSVSGGNLLATDEIILGGQPSGGGLANHPTLALSTNGIRRIEFSQAVSYTIDGAFWDNLTFVPVPLSVPEPGTLSLLGAGLLGLFMRRRRRA